MVDLRKEYPRPQFVREDWLCLNGEWDFEIDNAENGESLKFFERSALDGKITVPYCPESRLSGIGHTDFMNCVWYRKDIEIPAEWAGKRIILHFGAVDYKAKVYVNGKYVGSHRGGYTNFSFDITDKLNESGNYITLCAIDHLREHKQPSGKQSFLFHSHGCYYTRTTGIWQTVWMEAVDAKHIKSIKVYPDITAPAAQIRIAAPEQALGCTVKAVATYKGTVVGSAETVINSRESGLQINLSEKHLWEVGKPELYDLTLTMTDAEGNVTDTVTSYFGLREVGLTKKGMTINGKYVFGRWVLDQGFYPDGIYTAPSDEALKNDIIYSMQLGFNGARLHEKVFEPRFLYWADQLGYLVWGEQANWGLDITELSSIENFLPEWMEAMERDFNHPALIGWCPFNETWDSNGRKQNDMVLKLVYNVTKATDPTRPVIDTSGNYHVATDIFDVHDYEQDPEKFAACYDKVSEGIVNDQINRKTPNRQKYDTALPLFMSEYGGIKWDVAQAGSGWGYGKSVVTEEEFIERYRGLTDALLDNEYMMGFCYTQLYDVEQEVNGLMTYERKFKFDPKIFYEINTRKAAIED